MNLVGELLPLLHLSNVIILWLDWVLFRKKVVSVFAAFCYATYAYGVGNFARWEVARQRKEFD
jgi:hypothetical protein